MYKILIVDDEKMIREGIKKVINWEELDIHEVYLASSGKEAFATIQEQKPDILLTDISMAHMTGLELIEKTLAIYPDLKVLVLTGFDSFEYARKALRLKVQDFLLKPVDEDILTEAIRKQVILLKEETRQKEAEKEQRRITGMKEQALFEKNLRNLLHKRNIDDARAYFEENYESFCKANMSAAVLKLPLGVENEEEAAIVVCRQILSLSVSMIDSKELGVTIWDDDGKTLIVIIYVERCGSDGVDVIRDLCSIIQNEIGQSPRSAIGSMVNGYRSLDKSYYEAVCLLDNEREQLEEVLISKSIQNRKRMFKEVFEEMESEMCHNISNSPHIMKIFASFQKAVESYNLSDTYTRKCCFHMVTALYYAYIDAGAAKPEQSLDSFASSISGSSGKAACEVTQHYLSKLLSKDDEVHEIVSKAKYYVNQHLSDELSVSSIAESQFVSANYFSRLFKRVTGEGCNEYIVRKRMEKASMLLETTNFNTGKIASMVGYNDCNYFSITFKKHFGMSPTYYRNKENKKE